MIGPQSFEIGQLVQEGSVESPVSKAIPGKVVGHEDLDAIVVWDFGSMGAQDHG